MSAGTPPGFSGGHAWPRRTGGEPNPAWPPRNHAWSVRATLDRKPGGTSPSVGDGPAFRLGRDVRGAHPGVGQQANLEAGELRVNKALFRIGGEDLTRRPKSAKSGRSIALLPRTVGRLRELREVQARQREELYGKVPGPDGYIFCRGGRGAGASGPSDEGMGSAGGFAGLRLHDARHTHAAMLLRAGVHPKVSRSAWDTRPSR